MAENIKKGLLYFVFIVLLLPIAEQKLQFIKTAKLKGGFKEAPDTGFTVKSWLDGTYQHEKEQYLNDATGFRADLVRMNNQVDYSLFDKCHTVWTLKGKDGYLFQSPYIDAYYGIDYRGYDAILTKAIKLKAIQDTLARLGKSLILVYAPSKASYYPEYFPDDRITKKGTTNYETYRHIGDSLGINQVDMNAWFLSMKNKSKEPLFSKQGIHFTYYGALLAGDSLGRYMEGMQHVKIQHPDWSEMTHTNQLKNGDDDVASDLNLIFPVAKETLAYPVMKELPNNRQKKLNVIYIGDSYAHKMTEFGMMCKINDQCEFWSYFDEVHDINGHKFTYIKDYDWVGAMNRADCVVVLYTLFNFWKLGDGFIEQAYDHYYPGKG